MMYLLTQEEMNDLVPRAELVKMAERLDQKILLCEAFHEATGVLLENARVHLCQAVDDLYKQKLAEYEEGPA